MSNNGISTELRDTREFMEKNTVLGMMTVRDMLYAAVLGIMGGFISSLVPITEVMKIIYPFVGGQQLLSGHHLFWMAVSYGITGKKKSAPILTAFVKGIFESMLGDKLGAFIFFVNLFEGGCLVFGFYVMEKFGEGDTDFGWAVAGGIGNFFQAPLFWYINGRFGLVHYSLAIVAFIFAFLSGCGITGYLGKKVYEALAESLGMEVRRPLGVEVYPSGTEDCKNGRST